jgi:GSH-dependent disulfide-bond oxidoreductase
MIDLYVAPTPNGRRAAIILAEAELPHRIHRVSFDDKPQALLDRNPSGFIPVIEDDDGPGGKPIVIAQSGAIILYAAEKSGRFIPSDPCERWLALQRFMFACSDIAGASSALFAARNDVAEPSESTIQMLEGRMIGFLKMCEHYLTETKYLAGDVSIADFALYPFYVQRKALIDKIGGLDNFNRWAEQMATRPALADAMALKRTD